MYEKMFFIIIWGMHFLTLAKHQHCFKNDEMCGNNQKLDSLVHESKHSALVNEIRNIQQQHKECELTNCSCFLDVLKNDLEIFKDGITKEMVEKVKTRGTKYIIYERKLYRERDCLFPARCSGIEHFLLQLLPDINNMELIINTRDWPQINKHFDLFGPVLSFSRTSDYQDILYPAWSFWEGGPAISIYPTGLGRWDLQRKSLIKESKQWPWEQKKPMGFFRGSRTSGDRDSLILLSRKSPELVDAQYTKNQAWKSSADTLGAEPAKEVSLEYHCSYKYLFNFRGIAASFRFKHLFLCGSLVIHVGDEWIEFFYTSLKPWVHYVPLPQGARESDIKDILLFLKEHDDIARVIARNGQQFVQNHLRIKEVTCYWQNLLKQYQKLMRYFTKPDSTYIEIK